MPFVTHELIGAGEAVSGALNRRQFALIGVAWPPPHGWKATAIGRQISDDEARLFVELACKLRGKKAVIDLPREANKIVDDIECASQVPWESPQHREVAVLNVLENLKRLLARTI